VAIHDTELAHEFVDVFDVVQLTLETGLQSLVAADLVTVAPGSTSQIHRHNNADTVLYIISGTGEIIVAEEAIPVRAGERVLVGKAVYHGVITRADTMVFLSVQAPPILDKNSGHLDLEPAPTVPDDVAD